MKKLLFVLLLDLLVFASTYEVPCCRETAASAREEAACKAKPENICVVYSEYIIVV